MEISSDRIFTNPSFDNAVDMKALNIGIENVLNFKGLSLDQIKMLTSDISPFEKNTDANLKFKNIFPQESKINVGIGQTVSHNGGYEKLAYLYAAQGDVSKVLRCLDSLNKRNEAYDQNWNNSVNIGAYFLMYRHSEQFQDFIKMYSTTRGVPTNLH